MRMTPEDFKERARIGRALSHPTRLMIVATLLADGDKCVSELVKMIGCDQSTVSKHLAILRSAGIVEDRKEGSHVYYSLLTPCVGKFFECVHGVQEERRKRLAQAAESQNLPPP